MRPRRKSSRSRRRESIARCLKYWCTDSPSSGASPACGSCHTLADAGATGTIGPNLDQFLKGKDAAFIQQSIENPGAEVAKGFQDGIMPTNYGDTLSPEEIKALTDYLVEVASK